METIIKNGKLANVNNGGSKEFQERMIRNGWRIQLPLNYSESAQALYDRLAASGRYSDIKVYWSSTRIRGLHEYFAFVKG